MNSKYIKSQQGMALIVSLLLLLAITIIVLAASRGTGQQERMSANLYDRELAFQATESAIRIAEQWLMNNPNHDDFTGVQGRYPQPDPNDPPRWRDPATLWQAADLALGGLQQDAEFIIEDMGRWPDPPDCARGSTIPPGCLSQTYRITARSAGADRAGIMLQVLFRR
ncbi:PilX N-terminal domain-containing pilus assembly protein [Alkalimonas sp. MEB108]|uniref:PilX N-terminal domain-containing pilus assembly protein n=1 Tax=Alkalimonas cellulosilytica TaxID=3058395 RepID=A0ABU7J7U0_9GAMM|nr:PilX N-terminal domain-containing pilus assembly protein [Alkalimonas sp. MEB108]MEE2002611.1 PilX N-terminal domain-containing pilus assembly protein [Alkalimonas sp. MEB108]